MSDDHKEACFQKQRKWIRLESRAPLHYRIDAENTFKAGLIKDISEGGIKFEANRQIPLRAVLRLAIQLPLHARSLKTKAEVVSACKTEINGNYDIRVQFLDIKERTRSQIASYINEITSDFEEEEEMDMGIAPVFEERRGLAAPDNQQAGMKEADISTLTEEIESLEIFIDEEKEICQLGKLATFSFHDLEDCPPLMLMLKFRKAATETLLKKHGFNEEEMEKVIEKCKDRFKTLGTRYYIHTLKGKEE